MIKGSLDMILGLQKRQWLLLSLVLSVPFLLNAVGIWQDVGADSIKLMLSGKWISPVSYSYGIDPEPQNPLPAIFLSLLFMSIPLGLLTWLTIVLSNQAFFQRQHFVAKLLETLLAVSLIAKIYELAAGDLMPIVWLSEFHDYVLGIPGSLFMRDWSGWMVLPTTAVILWIAMLFSKIKKTDPV